MAHRTLVHLLVILVLGIAGGANLEGRTTLELTVDGHQFEINGTPKFLVFVSYFDALDASNTSLHNDFAALKSKGVDGVRIFPNWWGKTSLTSANHYAQDTVIDPDGNLRSGPLANLLEVLDIAKDEGLVVDISISAETVDNCPPEPDPCLATGNPPEGSLTTAELTSGLADLAAELDAGGSAYKHVLIDIQNECNHVGPSDGLLCNDLINDPTVVDAIAEAIHAEFPSVPVTISFDPNDDPTDVADFAMDAELDIATWHDPRVPNWWQQTGDSVCAMRDQVNDTLPVYFQEPDCEACSQNWTKNGAIEGVKEAKRYGAAAWCFHTIAGFYLNGTNFFANLTSNEEDFLDDLGSALAMVTWDSPGC